MWYCDNFFSGICIVALLLIQGEAIGQAFPEYNMSNTTIDDCQGILYDSGGPTAPYGHNENITTVIHAQGVMTLTFQGLFQLELNNDFLQVYDGPNALSPLLGTFTGTSLPPVLTANSGYATLVFTSNNTIAYSGFKLQWTSVQPMPIPPGISPVTPTCGSNEVNINLSKFIPCEWLDDASVTFFSSPGQFESVQILANCGQNGLTNQITVISEQPFDFNCPINFQFNISIPDNCGVYYPFILSSSFTISGCGVKAQITGPNAVLCKGECTTLKAHVFGCYTYTYSWNNGLPSSAGPHSVCPSQTTTYTVTITEQPSGAVITKTYTIEVNEAEITTLPQTVCQSEGDIHLEANAVGFWYGNSVVVGTEVFRPSLAEAGVNYAYFNADGCVDSVAITVKPIQTDGVVSFCPGAPPTQLQGLPTGGIWNGLYTTPGGMFTPTDEGEFDITYTVNGCTAPLTVFVESIEVLLVNDTICQSEGVDTLHFSPPGGTWSGAGIVDAQLGIFDAAAVNPGDVTLTYSLMGCSEDVNVFVKEMNVGEHLRTSCPTQSPYVVEQNPAPTGGYWEGTGIVTASNGYYNPFSVPNNTWNHIIYHAPNGCTDTISIFNLQTTVEATQIQLCISDNAKELSSSTLGFVGPDGGHWSGNGVYLDNEVWKFSPSIAGVGQHSIVYTNNACSDAVVVKVYPDNLPDDAFEFCSTDESVILLPDLILGGTWSGNGITDSATGLFSPSAAVPGSFYVFWVGPSGCQDSLSVTVEQFQQASIIGVNNGYCFEDTDYPFTVSPTGGVLSGDVVDYLIHPSLFDPGEYTVVYTFPATSLCPTSTVSKDFVVYPPLEASLLVSKDTLCANEAVSLTVVVGGGNPVSGYNYLWSTGGDTSASTILFTPVSDVTVSVEVSDGCSEPITLSANIVVLPPIEVEITSSEAVCPGELGFITAEVLSQGEFSVMWDGIEQTTVSAAAGTLHDLLVTDLHHGCVYLRSEFVEDLPGVTASFVVRPDSECITSDDKDNVLFIDISQGATSGEWDFGNGFVIPYEGGGTVTQSFPGPGSYLVTLTLQNAAGCEDSFTRSICVVSNDPVFIPDIFSPNGDGNNDILYVRGFGFGKIDFRIYNRWGEEVFHTADIRQGWDGTFKGKPALSGNYFYSFRAEAGKEIIEKYGEIALIR